MKYDDDTICRLNEAVEKWTAYSRDYKSMRVGNRRREAAKEEAIFLQELLFKVINMKG